MRFISVEDVPFGKLYAQLAQTLKRIFALLRGWPLRWTRNRYFDIRASPQTKLLDDLGWKPHGQSSSAFADSYLHACLIGTAI